MNTDGNTFRLGHIGINACNEPQAEEIARKFCLAFGFEYRPGKSSIFAGDGIEVMKSSHKGECGHIALLTEDVEEAMMQLEKVGIGFDMDTGKYGTDGKLKALYLRDQIGGFAVHLLRK